MRRLLGYALPRPLGHGPTRLDGRGSADGEQPATGRAISILSRPALTRRQPRLQAEELRRHFLKQTRLFSTTKTDEEAHLRQEAHLLLVQ